MVRCERGIGDAVIRMKADREHRRVVANAAFAQNVESPPGLPGNREGRSAKSADWFIGEGRENFERPFQVGAEFVWREMSDQAMGVAVGSDFVAAAFHLADQVRMTFGNPAKHEECALNAML